MPAASALALALVLAVALAAAVPGASAWASVAGGTLGVNVEVPSTAMQNQDSGKGSEGVLGVNVKVPAPTEGSAGAGNDADATGGATGVLGINLEVPTTLTQNQEAGHGSESVLGVNLKVPSPVADEDGPGASGDVATGGATGVLGVNLEVPSTVTQGQDGSGSEAVLGVNVKVPEGVYVSFDANGGQGSLLVPVVPGRPVEEPAWRDAFSWPGREITGWYTDPACADGTEASFPLDEVTGSLVLYAKWAVTEPRTVGSVELHMVDAQASISAGELATHGITGEAAADAGVEPGYAESGREQGVPAGAEAIVYEGSYFPGGDGSVWPGDDPDEGGTLALPTPEMAASADGMRDGVFVGWYRECSIGADGVPVYSGEVPRDADGAYAIGKFDVGAGAEGGWRQVFWAKWDIVQTHLFTFDANGGSFEGGADEHSVKVAHGERVAEPAESARPTREGYDFVGWFEEPEGATKWDFRDGVTANTIVYAKWNERPAPPAEHTVTFDAGKGAFEGAGDGGADVSAVEVSVGAGETAAAPDPAPKRPGWQFAGWYLAAADGAPDGWDDGGASAVPLGGKWDFASPVTGDVTLHAKWDLRLDVTVPVSVGFAVDADSLEVTTPDEGRYALKSRTVRPVSVDAVSATSEEAELREFFSLPDGEAWGPALGETTLSLRPDGAEPEVRLALADGAEAEDGESGRVWKSAYPLVDPDEGAAFTMKAFSYEGISFDESWRGADPSEVLPLKLGMELSGKLRVKTALDGPQKITHLKLTVSAEA